MPFHVCKPGSDECWTDGGEKCLLQLLNGVSDDLVHEGIVDLFSERLAVRDQQLGVLRTKLEQSQRACEDQRAIVEDMDGQLAEAQEKIEELEGLLNDARHEGWESEQ